MKAPVLTVMMICAATLGLHAATREEVKRILFEPILPTGLETLTQEEKWARLDQIRSEAAAIRRDDKQIAMSVYCELMEEYFGDRGIRETIMVHLYMIDGCDITSTGNQEALDWVRKAVREGSQSPVAIDYLMEKGDARDLELLSFRGKSGLEERVAGFNRIHNTVGPNWPGFTPSVTNTGPQALYVEAILRQYWAAMEDKSVTNIPPELITMAVWFDEDGNPVCNVDLEKYGLTMPELDVPNKPKGNGKPSPTLEGERPREPETSGGFQPPEQTPPATGCRRHIWLCAGVTVLTLGIGGLYAWRKKASTQKD